MSRHETGFAAVPPTAEPLKPDRSFFNICFSAPAPSRSQRAGRLACDALVYVGEATKRAGWHPVKLIPSGKRKRKQGWTPEPARRAETRKDIEEQRKIRLRQGLLVMQHLKAESLATKRFPKVYAGKIGIVSETLRAPFAAPASRYWSRRLEEMRTDDVDPGLQDKITALNRGGMSPEAVLYAVTKEGFEIDLDGVLSAIGPANQMFGDGRDAPLVDDDEADAARENEALNTNTMRGTPEKVVKRKSTYGKPWNERIAAYAPYERPWRRIGQPGWPADWIKALRTSIGCDGIRKGLDASLPRPRHPNLAIEFAGDVFRPIRPNPVIEGFSSQIVAFEAIASLWNERPPATTSYELGTPEHKLKLDGSKDGYDAGVRRRWTGLCEVLVAGSSERAWAEDPILWDEDKAARMSILSETDRKALDRIAEAVYAPRLRRRRLAKPHDGHREYEWATVIRNFACREDRVLMDEIGRHVLWKFNLDKFGKREQLRVGKVFAAMGWERFHSKSGRGFKPETVTP